MKVLSSRTCLKPVGQAGSVSDALAGIEATEPEALTLDISLPDGSGVEVLKKICRRGWDLCVMVFTGNPYEGLRAKCQQLGAVGVLDKLNGSAQAARALLEAIRSGNPLEIAPSYEKFRYRNDPAARSLEPL
jgi:DNA-binding NarL/FixJ family response regulator